MCLIYYDTMIGAEVSYFDDHQKPSIFLQLSKRKNRFPNILGSKRPLRIQFNDFKLNDKLEMDGYCDISIDLEDRYNVPKDIALDWPPYH